MATIRKDNDYEYRDDAGESAADRARRELMERFPELVNPVASEVKGADVSNAAVHPKSVGTAVAATRCPISIAVNGEVIEDNPPMRDVDLLRLEEQVRFVRKRERVVELPVSTVLSLIGESWYLRLLLDCPAPKLIASMSRMYAGALETDGRPSTDPAAA